MTSDLLRLGDWLEAEGVTHVAMESTGSYWHPVYNLLEERFNLLLVNTRHLKLVPGRKSDVRDAQWIAELLQHGLLRGSYVPPRPERELRELTRYRTSLVRERSAEVNRIQKVLEGANIKLAAVASDVVGVSGRQMIEALIAGVDDPTALAALARGRLQDKHAQLLEALSGRVGQHQRFMLQQQLTHLADLDSRIHDIEAEIERRQAPFAEARELLTTIPGVGKRVATIILSEVGPDVSRFPSADHLASWAGLSPGMAESGGRNKSGRVPKGNVALKTALVEAAHASARTDTFIGASFRRLTARLGRQKAAVAVAHSILVIAYHLLNDRQPYADLGPAHFDRPRREHVARRLSRRLEQLGYTVTITDAA
jgi:transposase